MFSSDVSQYPRPFASKKVVMVSLRRLMGQETGKHNKYIRGTYAVPPQARTMRQNNRQTKRGSGTNTSFHLRTHVER